MTDTEYVRSITKLTDRDHERLAGYYAKLRPEERIAVHGLQTGISQKLKARKVKSHAPAFYHATFVLAIRKYRVAQNPGLSKRMTKKEAAQIDDLQAVHKRPRRARKASAAQTLVERNYDLVRMLRDEKPRPMSWRDIAEKLTGNDVTISHTALKSIFERLEAEGGP
jgi:hypothetical protein